MPPRKPPPRRFQWHFLGGCITTYVNRPFPNLAGWASALRCCFRRTLGFLRHETTLKLKHLMVEWIRALIFYLQNGNISQEIFKMLRIFFGRCYLKRTWCVVWSCLKGTGTRNSWIHCFISITQDVTFSPTGVPSQFLYQRTRLQPHLYIIYIYITYWHTVFKHVKTDLYLLTVLWLHPLYEFLVPWKNKNNYCNELLSCCQVLQASIWHDCLYHLSGSLFCMA